MAQFNVPYVTPREKKLLRHFAEGKTDREIAVELGDREPDCRARQRVAEKLQIRTYEQLFAFASTQTQWAPLSKSL
jgi:DNA-binding CsgD family transcriptional regulator